MPSRNRGLGPQGHAILAEAAETFHSRGLSNPAVLSTSETYEEPDNWHVFDSDRVAEAAYDSKKDVLFVKFVKPDGSTEYVYEGVSSEEWRAFRRAASAGKYVNRVLNQHDYHRIR